MTWSVMSIDRCSLIAPIFNGGADTWRVADVRSARANTARDAARTVLRILHLRDLGVASHLHYTEGTARREAAAKPPSNRAEPPFGSDLYRSPGGRPPRSRTSAARNFRLDSPSVRGSSVTVPSPVSAFHRGCSTGPTRLVGLELVAERDTQRDSQSSMRNSATRENSRTLCVMRTARWIRALAATNKSSVPLVVPSH